MELARDRFASFDGTPIAYSIVGARGQIDAPVVLLANGLGGTAEAFIPLIERLPGFRFVSWDYRGLYRSGRPLRGYAALSIADHAKDALALLDHLDRQGHLDRNGPVGPLTPERVHALGWSMGVQVVLEMARHDPRRAKTLVLMGGVAGRPYRTLANTSFSERVVPGLLRRFQRKDAFVAKMVRLAADTEALVPLLIRLGLCHHDLDREVFRTIARSFKELDMHLYLELLSRLGEHDATDLLEHIEQPTLVVVGSADLLTPLAAAEAIARGIRRSELAVIPGGSHYAAVEMPDLIARRLRTFWSGGREALPLPNPSSAPAEKKEREPLDV